MNKVLLVTLLSFVQVAQPIGDHTFFDNINETKWCYKDGKCGETTWKAPCNSGLHQSPIDLPPDVNKVQSHREIVYKFARSNLSVTKFKIDFRGQAIQVRAAGDNFTFNRQIHGNHSVNYTLYGFDIHWGTNNSVGSEHTIGGKRYAGEVHLAFYDEDKVSPADVDDIDELMKLGGDFGLLIIGVLLDVARPKDKHPSGFMGGFTEKLSELKNENEMEVREDVELGELFKGEVAYRYRGSFTTPSCREVEWWVMADPVLVPENHMKALRDTYVDAKPYEGNNYR